MPAQNGITNVGTNGCNVVDQYGPGEVDGEEVTMRTVRANGLVRVTLWSYELPEDTLRRDAGWVVDPAVHINDLLIECPLPEYGGDRPPDIHYISARNTLSPLGG